MHRLSVKNQQSQDGFLLLPSILLVWVPEVTADGQLSSHCHGHLKTIWSALIKVPPRVSSLAPTPYLSEKGKLASASADTALHALSSGPAHSVSLPSHVGLGGWEGRREGECSSHEPGVPAHRVLLGIPHSTAKQGLSFQTPLWWSLGTREARRARTTAAPVSHPQHLHVLPSNRQFCCSHGS